MALFTIETYHELTPHDQQEWVSWGKGFGLIAVSADLVIPFPQTTYRRGAETGRLMNLADIARWQARGRGARATRASGGE